MHHANHCQVLLQEQVHDGSGPLSSNVWHADFDLCLQHIPRVNNGITDALSRFNNEQFWHLAPDMDPQHDATGLLPLLVSRPTGRSLHISMIVSPVLSLLCSSALPLWLASPCHVSSWTSLIQIVYSLPCPGTSAFQPCTHPLAGAWPLTQFCLSAHSKVLWGIQQSTWRVYGHA